MGAKLQALNPDLIGFIKDQKLFFVATAAPDGRVNMSPKGLDTLVVHDTNNLTWLNLTGSGNETAAHLLENDRMTMMFCSFDAKPLILRLYGHATVVHPKDETWETTLAQFDDFPSARQIFSLKIDLVQTSCGFGVPMYDLKSDRDIFDGWVEKRGGKPGVESYWQEKNKVSIDGKPTGI